MMIANAYIGKLETVDPLNAVISTSKSKIATAQIAYEHGMRINENQEELILHLDTKQLQDMCERLRAIHGQMQMSLLVIRRDMASAIDLVVNEIDNCNSLFPIPENRKAIVSILSFLPRSEAVTAVSICHTWHNLKWKVLARTVRFQSFSHHQVYQFWQTALEKRQSFKRFPTYQNGHHMVDKGDYHKYLHQAIENPTLDPTLQELLQNDVQRSTFNDGIPFQEQETRHWQVHLQRVLMAYAEYDPAVGYCQGMTFIVATILVRLEFDEALSFEAFTNMMTVYRLREAFLPGMIGTITKFKQLDQLISKHTEELADVFAECGMDASHHAGNTKWK